MGRNGQSVPISGGYIRRRIVQEAVAEDIPSYFVDDRKAGGDRAARSRPYRVSLNIYGDGGSPGQSQGDGNSARGVAVGVGVFVGQGCIGSASRSDVGSRQK